MDDAMVRFFEERGFDDEPEVLRTIHPGALSFHPYLELAGWGPS